MDTHTFLAIIFIASLAYLAILRIVRAYENSFVEE